MPPEASASNSVGNRFCFDPLLVAWMVALEVCKGNGTTVRTQECGDVTNDDCLNNG
jgi:hypothetical protein